MRKLLFGLIALVLVLLAAALIGPSFVDWNKYKPEIAERVKAATGRDITIGGDIKLTVLPAPTLAVHDVALANIPGAQDPNMASLKALDVRVALGALLEGRINVESIILVEPTISLEVMKDGRRNWDFAAAAAKPSGEAAPTAAAPESKGGGIGGIEVGRFSIENGTLIYRDAAGTVERIEKLNTDITAESLAGPISAEGDMVARGMRLTFKGDVGRMEGSAIPLQLDIGLPDADARATFKGNLSAPTADGKVTGTIQAEGSDVSRIFAVMAKAGGAAAKPNLPKPLAQKFSAAANLDASAKSIALNDLKVQLGDAIASGAINVVPGTPLRVDVTASMNSMELDPWLETTNANAPSFGPVEEKKNKQGAADKAAAPPAGGFSLPSNIAGSFDVSIETVVYKRDLIRQVKLRAALDGGKVSLKQAAASLPGGTSVSLAGLLSADAGKPAFDGTAEMSSDNLRGLFDWLNIDVSAVPAERLRRFSFKGKVKGTPDQFDVTGVDMKLDTSQITGGVSAALRQRPAFGARIDIDRFDLDAYLPPAPAAAAPAKGGTPETAPPPKSDAKPAPGSSPGGGNPALGALKSFDANIQGKIGSLTAHAMQVEGVSFDATLQSGVLTVRDVSAADFGGGSAKISGTLSGLGDKPAVDAKFDVQVKDASRLMRLANHEPPLVLAKLGAIALAGTAKGALDAFSFGAALDAAGGRITAQGSAGLPAGGPQYDVALEAKHDDLPGLVRVFNPEYRPASPNLGGLSLSLHAKGDASAGEISDLKGKIGPVTVSGNAKARFDGPRPAIEANLQASEIVADLFLPPKAGASTGAKAGAGNGQGAGAPAPAGQHWSKEPFDFSPLRAVDAEIKVATPSLTYATYKVDKPELQLSLKNGVLNIPTLKGTMFEGAFDLKGSLDANATPKLSGDVSINKANIHEAMFSAGNVDIAQGKLDYTMKANGSGASPFDLVSSLAGNGTVQVTDGAVRGFDLKAVSDRLNNINSWVDFLKALGTSMSGGQTNFSKLGGTFTIEKGVVRTNDIAMQGDASTGKAAGTIDLPAWTIDMKADFTLTQHPDIPSFGMQIVGPLDAPQRKFDTRALEALGVQKGVGTLLKKVLPGEKSGVPGAPEAPATQEKPLDTLLKKVIPGASQPAAQPAPAQSVPAQPAPAQPETGQAAPQQPPPVQPPPQQQPAKPGKQFENLLKKFIQPDTSQPQQPPAQNPPGGTSQ